MDHGSAAAGGPLIVFLLVALVVMGIWLWSLIHCITNKRLTDSNRLIGIIVIVVLGLLGSLIYLFLPQEAGKGSRYGSRSTSRVQRGRGGQPARRGTRSFANGGRSMERSRR